jgi:hypothetical protein
MQGLQSGRTSVVAMVEVVREATAARIVILENILMDVVDLRD